MNKFLIVGLGNKGGEYENTRHNIGFKIADKLADGISFKKVSFGWMAETTYKGKKLHILKPDTYMNLSGKAIKYWKQKLKIENDQIMVAVDDIHLSFGTIRIKPKGSNAGHNGLKSIEAELNTTIYPRLKFGIGSEFKDGNQINYVLGNWSPEEKKILPERINIAVEAIHTYCFAGINEAMNLYNSSL